MENEDENWLENENSVKRILSRCLKHGIKEFQLDLVVTKR